jgi:nucleoside-diphosphate-sugar epimerase
MPSHSAWQAKGLPFSKDPHLRKWNLWGYVDARDVAQSCRLALEGDIKGAEVFIIAAADTVMNRPNRELLAEVFPDVPLRGEIGEFETLLSIKKAQRVKRMPQPSSSLWKNWLVCLRRPDYRYHH